MKTRVAKKVMKNMTKGREYRQSTVTSAGKQIDRSDRANIRHFWRVVHRMTAGDPDKLEEYMYDSMILGMRISDIHHTPAPRNLK